MCDFSQGYALKNVNLIKLKNNRLAAIIDSNICNILYIAGRPLL